MKHKLVYLLASLVALNVILAAVYLLSGKQKKEQYPSVSPSPKQEKPRIIQEDERFLRKTGFYREYVAPFDMKRASFNAQVKGKIKKKGNLFVLPVVYEEREFELVLASEGMRVFTMPVLINKVGTVSGEFLSPQELGSKLSVGMIVSIDLPLGPKEVFEKIRADSKCTRECKSRMSLAIEFMSANEQFARFSKGESKSIQHGLGIGPVMGVYYPDL